MPVLLVLAISVLLSACFFIVREFELGFIRFKSFLRTNFFILLQVLDLELGFLEASSSVVGCDAPIRRVLLFLAIRLELERSRGLPLGYRAWRNQILL